MNREQLEELLKSIGKTGEKREEKLKAMKDLNLQNSQGIDISETADTYENY